MAVFRRLVRWYFRHSHCNQCGGEWMHHNRHSLYAGRRCMGDCGRYQALVFTSYGRSRWMTGENEMGAFIPAKDDS